MDYTDIDPPVTFPPLIPAAFPGTRAPRIAAIICALVIGTWPFRMIPFRLPLRRLAAVCLLSTWAIATSAFAAGPAADQGLELGSVHAAVADLETGEMLLTKHADRAVPIASVTKLMTAIVAIESGESLDEWLRVKDWHEPPAANAFSRIRLESTLQRRNFIKLALMASENRAAYVVARHHPGGYDAFVEDMNLMASRLGMGSSTFVDPAGLSENNVSTARDLVKLLAAAEEYDLIREASRTHWYRARFHRPRYHQDYTNTNVLVHRGWPIEVSKSGYLDASGRCLVMVTHVQGRRVAMVMLDALGTRTPVGDAGRISQWLRNGEADPVIGRAREYAEERAARFAPTASADRNDDDSRVQ